jgi:hypothetical protein
MRCAPAKLPLEADCGNDYLRRGLRPMLEFIMTQVTVVYWRDIPAQVIAGTGRRASRAQLSERFEEAIDRCAMQVGARDTDAYLAEWRKGEPYDIEGDAEDVASGEAARLESEFSPATIRSLIANEGWAARGPEPEPQ